MLYMLLSLLRDEEGGSMLEYAIIAALFATPCLAALSAIVAVCGATLTTTGNGLTSIGQTNP